MTLLDVPVPGWRRATVLVPSGSLLGGLAVGLALALGRVTGWAVGGLLLAVLLGEVLVLAGFVSLLSAARQDVLRPIEAHGRPQGWVGAIGALAPAAVTGVLCLATFGVLLLLLATGAALGAAIDRDLLDGAALGHLMLLLMGTGFVLVPATVQAGVLGAITGALVRRTYLDRDRRQLQVAREAARTRDEAAAVQATTTPGRGWRHLGRRTGLVLVALGLVLLMTRWAAAGAVLIGCSVGALLLRTWRGSRSPAVQKVRDELRSRGDLPAGEDDAAIVAFRADEMRAAATERGWVPVRPTGSVVEQVLDQLSARRSHLFAGVVDSTSFVVWDRIDVYTVSSRQVSTTRISGTGTSVEIELPLVVRLAVVPGGAAAPLAWSYVGPRIDLESGEFNARFDVYCDDPVRARIVLDPAVMALLLGVPSPLELVLDAGRLTLSVRGALLAPEAIEDLVRLAVRIRDSARAAMPRIADA